MGPPKRIRNSVWIAKRPVTARKMIALTLLRVVPRFWVDLFELLASVAPTIPTATAPVRARRMRCLLPVNLEIGFLGTCPLMSSLRHDNNK